MSRAALLLVATALVPALLGSTGAHAAGGADSLAGWYRLIDRAGHDVSTSDQRLAESPPDPDATVVLFGDDWLDSKDISALSRFLSDGGRVVVIGVAERLDLGFDASTLAEGSSPTARWQPDRDRTITGSSLRYAAYPSGPRIRPWAADAEGLLLALETGYRGGSAVFVADHVIFSNAHLAENANAALSLAVLGATSRPVEFRDRFDGEITLTPASGGGGAGGADPPDLGWSVWVLLALLGIAAWLWATGARLGPPEPGSRVLAPPRARHAQAVARALARAPDRADTAVEIATYARKELLSRSGMPETSGVQEVRSLALRRGLPPDLAETVAKPSGATLVDAGRSLARVLAGSQVRMQDR